MKKKKKHIEVPEVSDVKLKPLFGMAPGLYLTILYAILIVLILFFILAFPGLRNHGSKVHFTSAPAGASVFVDGTYIGSTPVTGFVSAGVHELRYEKPFFSEKVSEIDVPGKILGTLFFDRAESYSAHMNFSHKSNYLKWRFEQISNWALVGSFYERYRYPFRGVQAVREYYAAEKNTTENALGGIEKGDIPRELYNFTYMLLNNINSFEQIVDVVATIRSLHSSEFRDLSEIEYTSQSVSSQLLREAEDALVSVGAPRELAALYVERELERLEKDAGFIADRKKLEEYVEGLKFSQVYSKSGIQSIPLQITDSTFIEVVPPEMVPIGNNDVSFASKIDYVELSEFPHMEKISKFYISSGEVTRSQYSRFIEDQPKWDKSNLDELMDEGLVDEHYLQYLEQNSSDVTLPVTGVSWYAGRAYSKWLEEQLPDDLKSRFHVRLPSEAEWEYAARKNSGARIIERSSGFDRPQSGNFSREGRLGLIDMQGNVWEWCENWYFPSDVLDGQYGAALPGFEGSEKALRGGSWANRVSEVPVWRRASHPPQWCTPFVGFRIVLEPKED